MILSFDTGKWTLVSPHDGRSEKWRDQNGVQLIIDRIGFDRDLHPLLDDEGAVRAYYRDCLASQGIGIVECGLTRVSGHRAVRTIGKMIAPGKPALYIGTLAIPLSDRSFVLSLYAVERGMTGIRDTIIFSKLSLEGGTVRVDEDTGRMVGWASDPYFPDFDGPCLRNLSEDERYDADFPDHPLSIIRTELAALIPATRIEQERKAKPWWKLW